MAAVAAARSLGSWAQASGLLARSAPVLASLAGTAGAVGDRVLAGRCFTSASEASPAAQETQSQSRGAGGDEQPAAGAPQQSEGQQWRGQRGGHRPWRQREEAAGPTGNYVASDTPKPSSRRPARVAPREGQRHSGLWPAYIYNIGQSLTREDVAAFFDGFALDPEEIRPEFSWKHFEVERYWLNFASAPDRERALCRHQAYLGCRRVLMRRALPADFTAGIYNPLAMSSRGRYVLLENVASTSTSEDVLRFFQGFDLHAKTLTFLHDDNHHQMHPKHGGAIKRRSAAEAIREKVVVRFASTLEAHRAVRDRQGGFIGSSQVRLRVLQ